MDIYRGSLDQSLREIMAELGKSCDQIVLACHALQGMAAAAAADLPDGKFISLSDIVCEYVRVNNLSQIGLFGSPLVAANRTASPYGDLWDVTDVESPDDPDAVMQLIIDAKQLGAKPPGYPVPICAVHGPVSVIHHYHGLHRLQQSSRRYRGQADD